MKSESGFTLIELLVTCAIISILSGLSVAAFQVYRDSAELAKGVSALKNARTALGAGEIDFENGFTVPYTQTGTAGGPIGGALAAVMPGGNLPAGVRLGVEVNQCDENSGPFDRAQFLVSEPCNSQFEARWQRFCGGTEVTLDRVANPAPCA